MTALAKTGQNPREFLSRHVMDDWGELPEEGKKENPFSLDQGFRLLSAYRTAAGVRDWVITEVDRSLTTILLPEEYRRAGHQENTV